MTIDERLEKLAERLEALAQSVELLSADVRQQSQNVNQVVAAMADLVSVARMHERRSSDLEGVVERPRSGANVLLEEWRANHINWHTTLRRLRTAGLLLLVLGMLSNAAVWLAELLPTDASYEQAQQYLRFLPLRFAEAALLLGGLLYSLAWITQGFLPQSTFRSR